MGRKAVDLTITARLSSHNDEQDDEDRRHWEEFAQQVRALAERPEYRDIEIMVSA